MALQTSSVLFCVLPSGKHFLSLAGVFTGGVALYAALGESQAVRQQTAATVWPYVQVTIKDHVRDDQAEFTLELSNVGVGPARMREMQLLFEGEAQRDWAGVLTSILGKSVAERGALRTEAT